MPPPLRQTRAITTTAPRSSMLALMALLTGPARSVARQRGNAIRRFPIVLDAHGMRFPALHAWHLAMLLSRSIGPNVLRFRG